MLVEHDLPVAQRGHVKIVEVAGVLGFYFQVQHLVEVAIVQVAIPAYGNGIAAHEPFDGGRVEGLHQALHVGLVIAGVQQVFQKAADGEVGDAIELVENHSVTVGEFLFELLLERFL